MNYIASGGFSDVFEKDGCAYKVYKKKVPMELFLNEVSMLILFQKCNFAPILYSFDSDNMVIKMSKCQGNTIDCINDELTIDEKINIVKKLVSIFIKIHSHGIIYLDLKPENVIIDENKDVFLIDFNLCKKNDDKCDKIRGTGDYIPPEMWKSGYHYTYSSDVFSFGMLLKDIFKNDKIPSKIRLIMNMCINKKPSRRPGFQKILFLLENEMFYIYLYIFMMFFM